MTDLLIDFLVQLGVRSRCHRAPVYRATGWGWRAFCSECHRRVP